MDVMNKGVMVFLPLLILCVIFTSCSGPKKSTEEENVLNSLRNIQNKLEANISYDELATLLKDTKPQVDRLKQSQNHNRCFISAVDKCYASYEIARKAWKQRQETDNAQRRQDMEMTFAFSKSFAALSIERADNCYN
jgi:hypothetical protein